MLSTKITPEISVVLSQAMAAFSGTDEKSVWQRILAPHCTREAVDVWLSTCSGEDDADGSTISGLDSLLDADFRKRHGIYFTPRAVADEMSDLVPLNKVVLDPACGDGVLLESVLSREPTRLVGVEQSAELAVAAAVRLLVQKTKVPFFVHWGDGLEASFWTGVEAVVSNPPYVAEKGNAAKFEEIRTMHPDLADSFQPRMDLFYLFVERACAAGVPSVFLTSDYWLTATGAEHMRSSIAKSGLQTLTRLGGGRFSSAPGHHSLVFSFGSRGGAWTPPPNGPWHPFATVARKTGPKLRLFLGDFQGVVSGADRVTQKTSSLCDRPIGTPIFVRESKADGLWLPLLRARTLTPNRIFREVLATDSMLYIDGSESEAQLAEAEGYLRPFKTILSRRREVEQGKMHWTRLHWPRDRKRFQQPKIVVPRRAKTPSFSLDLAGHIVSSDCTALTLGRFESPIRSLIHLMVVLNTAETFEQLSEYGKRKGDIVEFYAAPLRELPLPVEVSDGAVVASNQEEFGFAESLWAELRDSNEATLTMKPTVE